MSNETKQQVNLAFEWISRIIIVSLGSMVLYFVQDIHSTIKSNSHQLESHEVRISVLEYKMK